MNSCDYHVSCRRYARLRPSCIAGATDPLSATVRRNSEPGFRTSSTKTLALCSGWPFRREAPRTVTFRTVTTRRSRSLHRPLNREVCQWVSLPLRPSSSHQYLPVPFVQPIVGDDSSNWLKPRAIYGEIALPSETGACDMQSTGTGSDALFASYPHAIPGARIPFDNLHSPIEARAFGQ